MILSSFPPEMVKEYGAVIVGLVVTLCVGLEEPLRKLLGRNATVQKVEERDQVSHDVVAAVAEAREKDAETFKVVLDRMEARELHLTAQNEELLRQAATRDKFYQSEMRRVQEASRVAHEEAGAARFDLELAIGREHDLQAAAIAQTRQHEGEQIIVRRQNAVLRTELEDYVRRYGKKGGEFSATDVLRGHLDP